MSIRGALDQLAAGLAGVGIDASADPRDLDPPCAFLSAQTLDHNILCGAGTLAVDVYLIGGDHDPLAVYDVLDDLLRYALTVIEPVEPTEVNTVVDLPNGPHLPAYRVRTTVEVSP